jgi:hypothetical protein
MDYRWEALFGIVSVAILFVPVFVAIFVAVPTRQQVRTARERRIADYRKSPASRLLILDDARRS